MLFDLYTGGHHGQYVRQMVDYWGLHHLPGRLSIVVPARFLDVHADVQQATQRLANVQVVAIEESLELPPQGRFALVRTDRAHGRLVRRYVERLRPDHCVLMYVDHVQLSLALDLTFPFAVGLSGIYFRPSFHYDAFSSTPPGWKHRLTSFRKRVVLAAALRNRHFTHLFCLDPYVVPHVNALRRDVEAVALPDGVDPRPARRDRSAMRTHWGVEEERRVALFFGSIATRKGIYQTLDALHLLSAADQQRLCLVLVGAVHAVEKDAVHEALDRVREQTAVQVIVDDRFVAEDELPDIFQGADLVLLPYQHHIGSSGVLVRAAHAARPVLGSDYGLIGEHLRRHTLGLPVDTTSPPALAAGLTRWLSPVDAFPFDAAVARRFADAYTAERFAATLFQHLGTLE